MRDAATFSPIGNGCDRNTKTARHLRLRPANRNESLNVARRHLRLPPNGIAGDQPFDFRGDFKPLTLFAVRRKSNVQRGFNVFSAFHRCLKLDFYGACQIDVAETLTKAAICVPNLDAIEGAGSDKVDTHAALPIAARARRAIRLRGAGWGSPRSQREIVGCLTCIKAASASWLSPIDLRIVRNSEAASLIYAYIYELA